MGTTLVAGIGNVFFSDDGFGVAVAAKLKARPLPGGVTVMDAGIRARDLAFELVDGGYDAAVLVDTVSRGGSPGTLYVIEPEPTCDAPPEFDGHSLTPGAVLATVRALGGCSTRVVIVGCEPGSLDEGMGLTPAVDAAIDGAIELVGQWLSGSLTVNRTERAPCA
jgi:hydrogenase maturation protease